MLGIWFLLLLLRLLLLPRVLLLLLLRGLLLLLPRLQLLLLPRLLLRLLLGLPRRLLLLLRGVLLLRGGVRLATRARVALLRERHGCRRASPRRGVGRSAMRLLVGEARFLGQRVRLCGRAVAWGFIQDR